MISAILLTVVLTFIMEFYLSTSPGSINAGEKKHIRDLYWWHLLFVAVYYMYIQSNASDSYAYYDYEKNGGPNDSWMMYYGIGTCFIHFAAYPFIRILGFSY